jgi:hypothetical protein
VRAQPEWGSKKAKGIVKLDLTSPRYSITNSPFAIGTVVLSPNPRLPVYRHSGKDERAAESQTRKEKFETCPDNS